MRHPSKTTICVLPLVLLIAGSVLWNSFWEVARMGVRLSGLVRDLQAKRSMRSLIIETVRPRLPTRWQRKLPIEFGPDVRSDKALRSLVEMGSNAASAIPFVIKSLNDPDPFVRRQSILALDSIGSGDSRVSETLIPLLSDPDILVRTTALIAVQKSAQAEKPLLFALQRLLADDFVLIQGEAIRALGTLGTGARDVAPLLLPKLKASNPHIRLYSAKAIWRLTGETNDTTTVLTGLFRKGLNTPNTTVETFRFRDSRRRLQTQRCPSSRRRGNRKHWR